MSAWILAQIVMNIVIGLGLYVMWVRLKRPPQDDPRLSRGLQLLQSKISVLEDLSDRTEVQVRQLGALLESKIKHIQAKIEEADSKLHQIDQAVDKSLEVAQIFQDKIPHEEIIERKNTIKYVQAARMAHAGKDIDEIVEATGLPVGEVEVIASVNKEQLMFDEDSLPSWVDEVESNKTASDVDFVEGQQPEEEWQADYANAFDIPKTDFESLKQLGDEFRDACSQYNEEIEKHQREVEHLEQAPERIIEAAKNLSKEVGEHVAKGAKEVGDHVAKGAKVTAEQVNRGAKKTAEQVNKGAKRTAEQVRKKADEIKKSRVFTVGVEKLDFPKIDKKDVDNNLG